MGRYATLCKSEACKCGRYTSLTLCVANIDLVVSGLWRCDFFPKDKKFSQGRTHFSEGIPTIPFISERNEERQANFILVLTVSKRILC